MSHISNPLDSESSSTVRDKETSSSRNHAMTTKRAGKGSCDCTTPGERKWLKLFPGISLTLENKGSVARDHLACERTWLAYMRTGMTVMTTGIALIQLFTIAILDTTNLEEIEHKAEVTQLETGIERYFQRLGLAAVFLGLCVLLMGILRYFSVQSALLQGLFPVARISLATMTLFLGSFVAVFFGIMLSLSG